MGSFANSLHIKCAQAAKVSEAIQEVLLEDGYRVTEEALDQEAMWGMSSARRGLHVAEAYQGWTGVLDSGFMDSSSLASELSRRLETHAIQFQVHDSDFWHYLLFHAGEQLDEFDSSGGQDGAEIEETPPGLAKIVAERGPAAMQQEVQRRAQQVQQRMEDAMPPEVREAHRKLKQRTASAEETRRYMEWVQAHMQQFLGDLKEAVYGSAAPRESRITAADLKRHARQLRPLLGPGATQERVLEVLGKQAVFAEEVLEEFLEVLGIQPFFARLGYRYLEECTASELRAANIKLVGHLKFQRQPQKPLGIFRPSEDE